MVEYIIKRLILAFFTLLAILLVSYVLLRLAPGDPTRSSMFGSDSAGSALDASKGALARNTAMREKLNLDKPVLVGFWLWLKEVARGDFGTSASVDPGRPVTELILDRLPVTVSLNVWAVLLTYLLAIPLGVYAAVHADSWFDRGSAFLLFLLYSLPVMWVALLLQSTLCDGGKWPLFPLKGLTPANEDALSTWQLQWEILRHYMLPVLCLTYANFAGLSRYARNGMLEVIHSDYIRTARAKGESETVIIWKHAFRNALITLITLFGGLLPTLVAGSLLVEYIFNIPGMGTLSLLALYDGQAGKYIAYFPSYAYLELIRDQLLALRPELPLHVQQRSMDEAARAEYLHRFETPNTVFLALCVLGGIFSEGIDLPGARLIGTAIVGVGLPQVNPAQEALRACYDAAFADGFGMAYRYPGMHRVLQAVGRVIRSETDCGVALLLDDRYADPRWQALMPPHYHPQLVRSEDEIRARSQDFWRTHGI